MLQYFQVTNHLGESLKLELKNPEHSGFFVKNIDGLGPTKVVVNTSEAINQDGTTFNSSRSSQRNIVLTLGYYWYGPETFEDIRLKSYRYFPVNKELTFEVKTDSRLVSITGWVESNEPTIFGQEPTIILSLLCPDAFFYGEDLIDTLFNGVSGGFEFPFEDTNTAGPDLQFGTIFSDTQKSVVYDGDIPTGVTIYINLTGAVTDLGVHNLTTGESMVFDSAKIVAMLGSGLQTNDQIIISSLVGNKFVYLIRGGNIYNILNALTNAGLWFTVDRGDNLFAYTATTGQTNIQFLVEHRLVYGGV